MGDNSSSSTNERRIKLVPRSGGNRHRRNNNHSTLTSNGRKNHLLEENIKEDRIIAQLEKNLKLKKKSSCLSKSFYDDGLDYLLETCDVAKTSRHSRKRSGSTSESDDSTTKRSAKDPFGEMQCRTSIHSSSSSESSSVSSNDSFNSESTSGDECTSTDDGVADLGNNLVQLMKDEETHAVIEEPFDDNVLISLKKHVKGSLNRLAEANMQKIATQIESLYMCNSRNSMNKVFVEAVMESVVSSVRTPERLVQEHSMLIAILHSNVDNSVGASVIHNAAQHASIFFSEGSLQECKKIDNALMLMAFLYEFKVVGEVLIYDTLNMLAERFSEKDVELILLLLRIVGMSLRKNGSAQLKELILVLQRKATAAKEIESGSRAQFMLNVLLAIKNNNVEKIPNYDPDYMNQLRKNLKNFLRPGCCAPPINMPIKDILQVGEQGILRCTASGSFPGENDKSIHCVTENKVSDSISKLAKKQRMNTDLRRSLFTILVTSEDYLDAFEKILRLESKGQNDYEVMNIIVHCAMQEKEYNPYYHYLACHFCHFNRKYLISLQFSVWDKLDELNNLKMNQAINLGRFVGFCIVEKGLPLSSLKVVDFSLLTKKMTRFLKEAMLIILSESSLESYQMICSKVTSPKLNVFKESLWLYVKHLLDTSDLSEDPANFNLIKDRVQMMSKIFGFSE